MRSVQRPPGSFSGFRQPRLRPASPGAAHSGREQLGQLVPLEPAGHQVVGRRHRGLVEHVDVEVDPEAAELVGGRAAPLAREAGIAQLPRVVDRERGQLAGEQRRDVGGLLGVARAEHDDALRRRRSAPPAASTHGRGPNPNATAIGMSAASPVGDVRPS